MPRFMPNERDAVCSALGRFAITGPTSEAAANSSAVLPRMTARYSSSVVAVFLAAASAGLAFSDGRRGREYPARAADLDHLRKAGRAGSRRPARWPVAMRERACPAAVHRPPRRHAAVLRCAEFHGSRGLTVAAYPVSYYRQRQHRPEALAADEIRWLATSGSSSLRAGARQDRAVDAFRVGRDKLDQPIYRWRQWLSKGTTSATSVSG